MSRSLNHICCFSLHLNVNQNTFIYKGYMLESPEIIDNAMNFS